MYKKSQNQRNVHPQQQLSLLCDLLYTIYFILLSSHTDHLLSDYSPGSSLPISWEKMELEFVPYRWDDVSCDVNASSETMEAGRGKKKKILWYWILWRVEQRGPSPPWVFLFIHFLIHRWDAWRGEALPNASGWGFRSWDPSPAPHGPTSPTQCFFSATTTNDKKFKFSTTETTTTKDKQQQFGYSTNVTTLITYSPTKAE